MDQPAICSAFDGGSTRFYAVDPAAGPNERLTALATVPGQVFVHDRSDRGWIVGWWERGPAAFEPARHEAIRLLPASGEWLSHLALGDTVLASVSSRGDRSTIRVYSMPDVFRLHGPLR
jgi:hypothetical protein